MKTVQLVLKYFSSVLFICYHLLMFNSSASYFQHTVHIPFLIADKFLVHHQYPKPFTGMITLLAFAMLYQCW